jgi:hypothetical protein
VVQDEDGLRDRGRAVRAAAEFRQDFPGLEGGVGALADGTDPSRAPGESNRSPSTEDLPPGRSPTAATTTTPPAPPVTCPAKKLAASFAGTTSCFVTYLLPQCAMPGGPQLISLTQDPGGTVHAVWEGLVGAIRDDWNSGQKDEAAGRGAIVLLKLVVGPKGAGAASKSRRGQRRRAIQPECCDWPISVRPTRWHCWGLF